MNEFPIIKAYVQARVGAAGAVSELVGLEAASNFTVVAQAGEGVSSLLEDDAMKERHDDLGLDFGRVVDGNGRRVVVGVVESDLEASTCLPTANPGGRYGIDDVFAFTFGRAGKLLRDRGGCGRANGWKGGAGDDAAEFVAGDGGDVVGSVMIGCGWLACTMAWTSSSLVGF